jgi:hypothetical protein
MKSPQTPVCGGKIRQRKKYLHIAQKSQAFFYNEGDVFPGETP